LFVQTSTMPLCAQHIVHCALGHAQPPQKELHVPPLELLLVPFEPVELADVLVDELPVLPVAEPPPVPVVPPSGWCPPPPAVPPV
jgi:hypothetical protein